MEFYQKLQKLRKEKGMSQEELANHLNVSRQAVSKWENDQGFPETEKLLQISSLFNVSLDHLLKEERPQEAGAEPDDGSWYASREQVEGFLLAKRSNSHRIAIGVAVLITSIIWVFFNETAGVVPFLLQAIIGVILLVLIGFRPKRYATELEERPLTFDPAYLRSLKDGYQQVRRWNGYIIAGGIVALMLAVVSQIVISMFSKGMGVDRGVSIMFLLIAFGVGLIIVGASAIDAYKLICENEKHIKETQQSKKTGWVMGFMMTLATAIFVGGGLIFHAWYPLVFVFPVAALLGAAIQIVVGRKD